MSVIDDLYLLKREHRLKHGCEPSRVKLGADVSHLLAMEMAESKDFFIPEDGRPMNPRHIIAAMKDGSVRLFGMTVEIDELDDEFPSPWQADAIEGYRQVGPC